MHDANLANLAKWRGAKTGRASSWDETGRNADRWMLAPGETHR